jgi:hypothetical protein
LKTELENPRALVRATADFWLLGGFSLVVLAALWAVTGGKNPGVFDRGVPVWAYYAAFAVNYPHFAYSYQLFYRGFARRLRAPDMLMKLRLVVAGLAAPLAMAGYFAYAFASRNLGMLSNAVIAMLFLVGWHYAKQGYGVLITASVYRKVFFSALEKRILYANAYITWLCSWIIVHGHPGRAQQFDLIYAIPTVPAWVSTAGIAATVAGGMAAIWALFCAAKRCNGLSWNGVTGYVCAVYLWLLVPQILGNDAVFMAVPFFHGLQYLPFVYKYKSNEQAARGWKRLAVFAAAGIVLGGLLMDIGPNFIDHVYNPGPPGFTRHFFLIALTVFINIHHYFIDHAFWRRDNAGAQKFLFQA